MFLLKLLVVFVTLFMCFGGFLAMMLFQVFFMFLIVFGCFWLLFDSF